jgi:hypothetical protein
VVKNDSRSIMDITTVTAFGSKTVTGVAPGASASGAVTTRAVSIPAGTVAATGKAVVDGKTVTAQTSVDYPARSCR